MKTQQPQQEAELKSTAEKIRRYIVTAVHAAQSGHAGPSLSMVEIMATLRFNEMSMEAPAEDYFILSKGHAAPCYYAAETAAGRISYEELTTLRQLGSPLQGHPVKGSFPFIDASTGSLGQGLSIGIGYALGNHLNDGKRRIYVVLGDGELQEGQIWEAAMAASKFNLGNVLAIVDYNKFQNEDAVEKQMPLEPLADKWRSFNWHVQELKDGHSISGLLEAYSNAREETSKPSVIIAHTTKGKGISFMEGSMEWHSRAPSDEEYAAAMQELSVS